MTDISVEVSLTQSDISVPNTTLRSRVLGKSLMKPFPSSLPPHTVIDCILDENWKLNGVLHILDVIKWKGQDIADCETPFRSVDYPRIPVRNSDSMQILVARHAHVRTSYLSTTERSDRLYKPSLPIPIPCDAHPCAISSESDDARPASYSDPVVPHDAPNLNRYPRALTSQIRCYGC